MKIGVIGAMQQEIDLISRDLENSSEIRVGMREYLTGNLYGADAVLVFSKCGKVAAASAVTTLIDRFKVDVVIFTGAAGAASPDLNVGDIVIADRLLQYDMDASASGYAQKYEIPLLGKAIFDADTKYVRLTENAGDEYVSTQLNTEISNETLKSFGISAPKVVVGTIASGDQFIADSGKITMLRDEIDNLKCIEMEGAAAAQVCYEHGVPLVVIRVMSDSANESANIDFGKFIESTASYFTRGVVKELIENL